MTENIDGAERGAGWAWILALGIGLILGVIAALTNAVLASLMVVVVAAAFFAVAGALELLLALRSAHGSAGARLVAGILGVLLIIFAVSLYAQPFAGLVSLSLLVAAVFLAAGLMRIWLAARLRHRPARGWMLASGIVSALLGLVILLLLPGAAPSLLGILLGIELVVSGAAAVALALGLRGGAA